MVFACQIFELSWGFFCSAIVVVIFLFMLCHTWKLKKSYVKLCVRGQNWLHVRNFFFSIRRKVLYLLLGYFLGLGYDLQSSSSDDRMQIFLRNLPFLYCRSNPFRVQVAIPSNSSAKQHCTATLIKIQSV